MQQKTIELVAWLAEQAEIREGADLPRSRLRDAAELIQDQQTAMTEAAKIITELCQTHGIPLPEATMERLLGKYPEDGAEVIEECTFYPSLDALAAIGFKPDETGKAVSI